MSHSVHLVTRFTLPLFVWLLAFWQSIDNMVGVWAQSKTYEHCYLIIPICLWLVWQKKPQIRNTPLSIAFLPALLVIFPSLLWIVGRTAGIAFFEHVAVVTSLQLILWALIGHPLARVLAFPLIYLGFCIPFGEELIPLLQSVTAHFSVVMVRLSGVPVFREGLYLTLPNGQFEIAEACSGIRFLISSIALGTLFAHVFFVKKWKFFLYVLFSCLFPILANGIRAYGIIMIGYLSGMKYATGADHLIYGWLFFALVIAMMLLFSWRFQDISQDQASLSPVSKQPHDVKPSGDQITATIIILVDIMLGVQLWNHSIESKEQVLRHPINQPQNTTQIASSDWGIHFPLAKQSRLLQTNNKDTEIFTALYSLYQKKGELISYENQIYNKEYWSLLGQKTIRLSSFNGASFPATLLEVVNHSGQKMKILYWYCINDSCSNNKLRLKLQKTVSVLSGEPGFSQINAIASPVYSEHDLQIFASDWISNKL
ncbi:MAG: exosortase A [Vibrio sp.]|uniref:exosortase A n=1 Tax=Vibrio sp. TaxID=678 RepID=UPI003A8A4A9C